MSIDTEKLSQFFSRIKLEQIYNSVVIFIIAIILLLAAFALYRPLSIAQVTQICIREVFGISSDTSAVE